MRPRLLGLQAREDTEKVQARNAAYFLRVQALRKAAGYFPVQGTNGGVKAKSIGSTKRTNTFDRNPTNKGRESQEGYVTNCRDS
jgi:hypothetical protein